MTKGKQHNISPEKLIRERGRSLEIHECYMDKELLKDCGETTIIITRRHKGDKFTVGIYLLDTYCTGVKDTFYRTRMDEMDYKDLIQHFSSHCNLQKTDYIEVHNWIFGAVEFAEEAGIKPHKDFAVTKWLLEDDEDESIPIIEYEFGKNGKHFLVSQTKADADKYIPLLRKNLGNDFQFIIKEPDFWGVHNTSETQYEHTHRCYPSVLDLKHKELISFIHDHETVCPSREAIDTLLNLDWESLRTDIENLILFETGCTCDRISEARWKDFNPTIIYSLLLLGETGDGYSIDVVLETLRQNEDYMECHFGDYSEEVITPVLCKLAKDSLGLLFDFLTEPGLFTFSKSLVFPAVYCIGHSYPDKKEKAVEWFRNALAFIAEELPKGTRYCDGILAGFAVHHAINLDGKALKDDIKAVYDTNLIDTSMEGTWEDVRKDIESMSYVNWQTDYELDILKEFEGYHRFCKRVGAI